MSYPEKGATYRNKPAWMNRAVDGEKRAQGGPVSIGNRSVGNGAGVRDIAAAATEDAKEDLGNAVRFNSRSNSDESQARKNARGRLSSDPFEAIASGAGSKRADGGAVDETEVRDRKRIPLPSVQKPDTGDRMEATRVDGKGSVGQFIKDAQQKMGRGLGQSIGFKRGGRAGC